MPKTLHKVKTQLVLIN